MREWRTAHPGWWTAIVATVALFVGVGIGVSGNQDQDRVDELEDQVADLRDDVSEAEREAEDAEEEFNDRLDSIDAREDENAAACGRQAARGDARGRLLEAFGPGSGHG
jgi:hypothetical protein